MLGLAMTVLGINILGNMNKESMSQKSLGLPFWRITLASAILVFILGLANIFAVRPLDPTSRPPRTDKLTLHRATSSATRPQE